MRTTEEVFLKLGKAFVVRSTETLTPNSKYLSWAARDFGMPWSDLRGAILFPDDNINMAREFAEENGGHVVEIWTDEFAEVNHG